MSPSTPPTLPTLETNLGLKDWWCQFANLTAVALVCLMFWRAQGEQFKQAHDDRIMFREELVRLHEDSMRQARALQRLADEIHQLRKQTRPVEKP